MTSHERGMILVVVLMLLGVIAGLSVGLITAENMSIKKMQSITRQSLGEGYLKGAELWADNSLRQALYDKNNVNLRQFPKVMPPPSPKIPDVDIQATLYDAQGQFYNINNLSNAENIDGFKSFVKQLMQNAGNNTASGSSETVDKFCDEIAFWITDNTAGSAFRDSYYLNLPQPYRVAHQLLVSLKELSGIQYYDKTLFQMLAPYLIALPEVTPININTVNPKSSPILMTLKAGIDLNMAQQVVMAKSRLPSGEFETTYQFLSQSDIKPFAIPDAKISLQSQFFLLETRIKTRGNTQLIYTLLQRKEQQGKPVVEVVWEKQNYL